MPKPQKSTPPGYHSRVKSKFKTQRTRFRKRIADIVAKKPGKKYSWLSFSLYWNGHHELSVSCSICDDSGQGSSSTPYGHLIVFESPPVESGNSRDAFKDEKPKIVQEVIDELIAAWSAAKGTNYPLPVLVSTTDLNEVSTMTTDVPPNAKVFDLKLKQWVPDEFNLKRGSLNAELRGLIRTRFTQLQADLVLKLQKITRARPPKDAEKLIFELHDVTTDFTVMLYAWDTSFARTIFSNETLPDGDSIDWTYYSTEGADVWHCMKDELIHLLAEAWREAGGDEYPLPAFASEHDGGGEFDLKARRWVSDFLGREILA
jgi:hypothetical protein